MPITPLSFFKCLADDTRLKSLLLVYREKELCVCDLINALQLSQPKVSRHLAQLRKCQLLVDERRGKWVYYTLNPQLPQWAVDVLSTTAHDSKPYLNVCINNLNNTKQNASCC